MSGVQGSQLGQVLVKRAVVRKNTAVQSLLKVLWHEIMHSSICFIKQIYHVFHSIKPLSDVHSTLHVWVAEKSPARRTTLQIIHMLVSISGITCLPGINTICSHCIYAIGFCYCNLEICYVKKWNKNIKIVMVVSRKLIWKDSIKGNQ
jgi:hypothetical protein